MTTEIWLHGTEVRFSQWCIPGTQLHKNGAPSHSAIFFTTDRNFALAAANGKGFLCQARLDSKAKILDMNQPGALLSEIYRGKVLAKPIGSKHIQVSQAGYWEAGWMSGSIMKYLPGSESENETLQAKAHLARTQKHTPEGAAAFNELQLLTRSVIEELVVCARDLKFDAVIGNEIDTLPSTGPVTYRTMFALNPECLTPPVWER